MMKINIFSIFRRKKKSKQSKNTFIPVYTPKKYNLLILEERVIVESYERSPVDMLALRIAQNLLTEGIADIKESELGGMKKRYTMSVTVAIEKK